MQVSGSIMTECREIISLQDIQLEEQRDSAAVGRLGEDGVAAIGGGNGLDPLRLVAGQILIREKSAVGGIEVGDVVRDLPLVEDIRAFLRDPPQGPRQVGLAKNLAWARRASAGKKYALGRRVVQARLQHLEWR